MFKFTISGYSYQTIEDIDNILILHINEKTNNIPERFCGVAIGSFGDKWHWKDRELHRDNDLPAVEYANGDKQYFKNGNQYYPPPQSLTLPP
jgi:hypothetical protein